jgi:hypothetical protein
MSRGKKLQEMCKKFLNQTTRSLCAHVEVMQAIEKSEADSIRQKGGRIG